MWKQIQLAKTTKNNNKWPIINLLLHNSRQKIMMKKGSMFISLPVPLDSGHREDSSMKFRDGAANGRGPPSIYPPREGRRAVPAHYDLDRVTHPPSSFAPTQKLVVYCRCMEEQNPKYLNLHISI